MELNKGVEEDANDDEQPGEEYKKVRSTFFVQRKEVVTGS